MNTVYTNFQEDDIVSAVPSSITTAMWSTGNGILTTFYTQSGFSPQVPSRNFRYYVDILGSNSVSALPEFSIAYGDINGYGAPSADLDRPTLAVYNQMRNMLLDNPFSQFSYISNNNRVSMDRFFAISIKMSNLKQKMDVGNFQLNLNNGSKTLHLVDSSFDYNNFNSSTYNKYYTIVSGTIGGQRVGNSAYGLVFPDYGIILLDANQIGSYLSVPINSGSASWVASNGYNNLFNFYNLIKNGGYFSARSQESINSTHYFVRIKNQYYNYSTNPTFYSQSDGSIINPSFYNDPHVFITTIGLYNDNNELLAVAKLSKPIHKAFDKEALVKIRLDF